MLGREPARATAHATHQPAMRSRPKSRVGLGLAVQSSGGNGPRAGVGIHALGAVVHTPMVRLCLTGDKVLMVSTEQALGRRRAGSQERSSSV
jgi:hypothetical protein